MTHLRVAALQTDIVWEDPVANVARIEDMLARVRPGGPLLIVLPEMAFTGYSMRGAEVSARHEARIRTFLDAWAARLDAYVLAGSAYMDAEGTPRNGALLATPDGSDAPTYWKQRLFSPAGEHISYRPGEEALVFNIGEVRVAPSICYDLRFPEIYREQAARGAHVMVNIASWPAVRSAHWAALTRARAMENQAYFVGVNRAGCDPALRYRGGTVVVDPTGALVARAGTRATTLEYTVSLQRVVAWRAQFPALTDAGIGAPEQVVTALGDETLL